MTFVDLLSDTTYRQQAVKQLHQLLGNASEFPVESTQIYGLRQIARQQPNKVADFAQHQGERAEKLQKQAEVDFWTLVTNLCSDSTPDWSVSKEGQSHLPLELQDRQDASRRERRELRTYQEQWFKQWKNEHIPAFFERFCTHCLFCIAKAEMGQLGSLNTDETDQLSQQEQGNSQNGNTMQTALQQANLTN